MTVTVKIFLIFLNSDLTNKAKSSTFAPPKSELADGVTVTQRFLVPLSQVRILVGQLFFPSSEGFFCFIASLAKQNSTLNQLFFLLPEILVPLESPLKRVGRVRH